MAVTGLYYHLEFKNAEKAADETPNPQQVHVRIYDLTLEDETTTGYNVIELTGSGDPFRTATVDNSEDKFTGIKPTQATIKFLSSEFVDLSTFVNGAIPSGGADVGDPRFKVEAYLNANLIFVGFLNLDDCYEAFLPVKNEVVLVANDGLGGLQNIPLTDFNEENPTGYNRVSDFLTWALSKTGLSKKLNAVFNIREASLGGDHFFDKIFLHSKTFEEKISTSVNCYEVIERILGEEAFLTQWKGEWFIMRVDELAGDNPIYRTVFDTDGTLLSSESGTVSYNRSIFKESSVFFSQEATTVHPLRPHKSIKETYKFDYPQEIIDNIDFSRGDLITTLPTPDVTIDGVTYYQRKYNLDDWTALEVPTGVIGGTPSASTTNNYIRRLFTDSTLTLEKERVAVIEAGATAKGYYIQSNKFPVVKNDKFDISVDVRWTNDGAFPSSGSYRLGVMQVRLHGNIGTNYMLCGGYQIGTDNYQVPFWKVAGPSFSGVEYLYVQGNLNEAMNDWKTVSFITNQTSNPHPCPPIPDSGEIEITIIHGSYSNATDMHINNLRFTYVPYINGGYPDYAAHYYKIFQDNNFVNKREKQVYLHDFGSPLMKGQLFKQNGSTYELTNQFFAWNDIQDTTPDDIYVHPYAHIQAYDVWNQYRNPLVKFQATCQGLVLGIDDAAQIEFPRLIHRWFLEDTHESTDGRRFMLLSFDINWYSCEWTGVLMEIYNENLGKSYLDNLEIKYE